MRGHVQHRYTSRAVLVSESNTVLLFLTHFDPGAGIPPRWLLPGGGIELGETRIQCLLREIREETGIILAEHQVQDLGVSIAFRQPWQGEFFESGVANIFLARVAEFEPSNLLWTPEEHRDNVTHRWWSLNEIRTESPWIGPDGVEQLLISLLSASDPEPT